MSQSLTRCKIQVNPTLNNSDRLILGEIIVREIRSRTRSGRSARGGTFAKYSPSYTRLLRRRGAATNVDLDRSGQMLESLRVLEHGPGFITVGISSMDKAAFAKAKYTQGQGRGPARLWLRVSTTFVRTQERAILQAGAETATQLNEFSESDVPETRGDGAIPLDISADADRRTFDRLLGESPDRAGITRRDEILLVRNRLVVDGLSASDTRALRREERRLDRRDRLDSLGALEIEALRFVRESPNIQRQFPVIGRRLQDDIQEFRSTGPAPTPIVQQITANPIILRNPIADLQQRESVERQQRLQSELDALSSYEGYNRIDTIAADPSTRIEQAIPIAERVREEPTVGIDIESVQRGVDIDRNLGTVRGNTQGRDQVSLSQAIVTQRLNDRMRNTLLRRQQIELDRIEQQRNRERLDGIRTTGSEPLDTQLQILKQIRRSRRGGN